MLSLYQKYRPTRFAEVVGNTEMLANLNGLLKQPDPPHAFLLTGPTGCGKTTVGRIAASELGCAADDFTELDSADFRGIDTIRNMRHNATYKALRGERRVWLIDECHKLTNDAQNALLKGLEDPPEHCFYFLATTEPDRVLETIRGRCIQQVVRPLTMLEMMQLLGRVARAEGHPLARNILRAIAQRHVTVDIDSKGDDIPACYPRFALQLLEKVLASPPEDHARVIELDEGLRETIDSLVVAMVKRQGWTAVAKALSRLSDDDVERVRWGCLNYCKTVLLKGENDTAAEIIANLAEPFFQSGLAGLTLACYTVVRKPD